MFFIWGFRTKNKPHGASGQFFCPSCSLTTTYVPLRQTTYWHIFFVPLIPVSSEPHGIQCTGCRHLFEEDAIHYRPKEKLSTWNCPKCFRRWSETSICCPICKVRPDGTSTRGASPVLDGNEKPETTDNPMNSSGGAGVF